MIESKKKENLSTILKDNDTVLLTTSKTDGTLASRPMGHQNLEANGDLWLMTRKDTAKYDEIRANPKVNLSLMDKSYAVLTGTAEIVEDPSLVEKYWNKFYEKLFQTTVNDPTLVMIKVDIDSAEHWKPENFEKNVTHFIQEMGEIEKHTTEDEIVHL